MSINDNHTEGHQEMTSGSGTDIAGNEDITSDIQASGDQGSTPVLEQDSGSGESTSNNELGSGIPLAKRKKRNVMFGSGLQG